MASPDASRVAGDEADNPQPGTLKVSVQYAETGDSQVLYFPRSTSTVEDLKQQIVEYAEHGVNCKPNTMILLLDDGTSVVKNSTLLSSLSSLTVFVFGRETLMKTYSPSVALEDFRDLDMGGDFDIEMKRELCERCSSRCSVQIAAGDVALKNLLEHSKSVAKSLTRFKNTTFKSYLEKARILSTFENDLMNLGKVLLARQANRLSSSASSAIVEKSMTLLDVLPKDKLRRWAEEAIKQHEVVEVKHNDLHSIVAGIQEGCEAAVCDWDATRKTHQDSCTRVDAALRTAPDSELDTVVRDLKQLKTQTTKALYPTLLRVISTLQSRIQDVSNRLAALKEALIIQEQKLTQIGIIRSLPDAYQAGLREADRRRAFNRAHYTKVEQLTDFIARERNKELERREHFQRAYGKLLPPELIPGLYPWVFPPCEVTQRTIDPVLAANVLELAAQTDSESLTSENQRNGEEGEVLFEPDSASDDLEINPIEVLQMKAELEIHRAKEGGTEPMKNLESLKEQYQSEIDRLKARIEELEKATNAADVAVAQPADIDVGPVDTISSPSNVGTATSPSNDGSGADTPSVESPTSRQPRQSDDADTSEGEDQTPPPEVDTEEGEAAV